MSETKHCLQTIVVEYTNLYEQIQNGYDCEAHANTYHQAGKVPNRLFYLSIPPNIFVDVVRSASRTASSQDGWTRFIVEKPFGRDSESSGELTRNLKKYLAEEQIFRFRATSEVQILRYWYNPAKWTTSSECTVVYVGLTIIWGRSWLRTSRCSVSPISSSSHCGRGTTSGMCSSYFLKISARRVEAGLPYLCPLLLASNVTMNWNIQEKILSIPLEI